MPSSNSNIGVWISGVLLLGSWILQDYLGTEIQSIEQEISRFEVSQAILDLSDQQTDIQDLGGTVLAQSVLLREELSVYPDDETEFSERVRMLNSRILIEKVSTALHARQGSRYLLLFSNYKFDYGESHALEYIGLERRFGDQMEALSNRVADVRYPDRATLDKLEIEFQDLKLQRTALTDDYIADINTNSLLITQDLLNRREKSERWAFVCRILTFLAFVTGSFLSIVNQLHKGKDERELPNSQDMSTPTNVERKG